MNKKNSMIMVVLFLFIAGAIFAGLFGRGIFREKGRGETEQAAAPPGHQGHGGVPAQPQAAPPSSGGTEGGAVFPEETQTVEIPEAGQRFIGVKTTAAAEKPLQRTIRTVGRVEYDERRIATVNTKIEGWIEHLRVDYTGRYVRKGEVLAEIYSPELVAGQQEYLNILKWSRHGAAPAGAEDASTMNRMLAQDAEAMRHAARQRLRFFDISEAQIRKIE
ncbi:MAG: efflux RND transporter periplasmic adaptor subunit, partial [Pseudomonadota bacterium]